MINGVELASRPMYRVFLQGVLVLVKAAPRAQTGAVIAAVRIFLGMGWALVLGVGVLLALVAREYLNRQLKTQQQTIMAQNETKVSELETKLDAGREERLRLKESSDVVVECVKALQRKLQSETQLREQFVETTGLEKEAQNKKLDSLINRLNMLKNDLKEGLMGMDSALRPEFMAGDN